MNDERYILSIDPGLESGISLIGYRKEGGPWLERAWQFKGGAFTLRNWIATNLNLDPDQNGLSVQQYLRSNHAEPEIVAEKFTARNTKGFSYSTASLEPLRGEGVLIALGLMPDYEVKEKRWRDPGQQYLVGGKDLADKKKRQHRFLDESGFRIDSKVLGYKRPDYNDARSAAAHGLKYLASVENHKPTFDLISNWVERNPV